MTIRRSLAVLLTAGLALTAAACSGDDDPEEGSDTTTTEASTTTVPETTTTISDDDYFTAIEAAEGSLAAAGNDLCKVSDATAQLPPPGNPAQVERALGVYKATYEAAAAALEADDPTSAAALRTAVTDLIAAAEAAEYSTDFLTGDTPPEALTSEEFSAASQALQTKYNAECAPADPAPEGGETPDTTVPESAPGDE